MKKLIENLKYSNYSLINIGLFPRRVHIKAECDYLIRHMCPSVGLHGITGLLLDGFALNLIFEHFGKSMEKVQVQRVLSVEINIHF